MQGNRWNNGKWKKIEMEFTLLRQILCIYHSIVRENSFRFTWFLILFYHEPTYISLFSMPYYIPSTILLPPLSIFFSFILIIIVITTYLYFYYFIFISLLILFVFFILFLAILCFFFISIFLMPHSMCLFVIYLPDSSIRATFVGDFKEPTILYFKNKIKTPKCFESFKHSCWNSKLTSNEKCWKKKLNE